MDARLKVGASVSCLRCPSRGEDRVCLLLQYLLQSCSRDPSALENIVSQGSQKRDRWPREPRIPYQDLPGFHTADDDDTKPVNIIVKRYVEMPRTLALHVVKGDQGYGSLFGNDVLRGNQACRCNTCCTAARAELPAMPVHKQTNIPSRSLPSRAL